MSSDGRRRLILKEGERKAIQTDRTILVPGSQSLVKCITHNLQTCGLTQDSNGNRERTEHSQHPYLGHSRPTRFWEGPPARGGEIWSEKENPFGGRTQENCSRGEGTPGKNQGSYEVSAGLAVLIATAASYTFSPRGSLFEEIAAIWRRQLVAYSA